MMMLATKVSITLTATLAARHRHNAQLKKYIDLRQEIDTYGDY